MARVLVVDDEENIRVAFKDYLEQDGHKVHRNISLAELAVVRAFRIQAAAIFYNLALLQTGLQC